MPLLPHILIVSILVWIRHLILKDLDELVEDDSKDSADSWTNPYNAMINDIQ
jgi:hypothetical protein